jgi:hypothetical protein
VPGIGDAAASAPVVLALVRESVEAAGTGALSFRLPLRAKSAMAEILVSDHCERRPPLLSGGRLRLGRAERRGKLCGLQVIFCTTRVVFSVVFNNEIQAPSARTDPLA